MNVMNVYVNKLHFSIANRIWDLVKACLDLYMVKLVLLARFYFARTLLN